MAEKPFEELRAVIRRGLREFLDLGEGERESQSLLSAIDELKARLGAALAAQRRIARETAALTDNADFSSKAEIAIELGREDLARAALRKKAQLSQRAAEIDAEIAAIEQAAASIPIALGKAGLADDDATALDAQLKELEALVRTARHQPGET